MKDKRFETLRMKYSLSKKKKKKVICPICSGKESMESYPKYDCSECGGSGFILEEEE